ncbi:FixH family protein [Elongatibacter sediminis]|uniref:FixH family protein n=1 Tax=Elongatibacter sediminis TaxID=3119006 RepID=A0AAW9RLA5_9GAMM
MSSPSGAPRPWYREPWPWVLIAIPAITVVACGVTLWLALSRPETVVLDLNRYEEVKAALKAQPAASGVPADRPGSGPGADDGDGER